MLNNLRTFQSLYRSLGASWLGFRLGYAVRMRTGLVRLQIPTYEWDDRPLRTWLKAGIPSGPDEYARWRRENSPPFFFDGAKIPGAVPWDPQQAVEDAERILNGEIKFFSHEYVGTGFPPDWHTDPTSGVQLDSDKHWSRIPDDGQVDIKFVWEVSRFATTYTLVRAYASSRDERFAEAFWDLVASWAESNPPNRGANWKDGQEIALRLMAWCFGLYGFSDSPSTTPERTARFAQLVAAQAERIHQNLPYAISTNSNHTISEAFGLWMIGLLFPELKGADKYRRLGRELLEQNAAGQILPDGTYSMYSLNYHRFVLQIYLFAVRLGALNQAPLSKEIEHAVTLSLEHLNELIDAETGQMPVYGSNDGALVLPANNCDFTDYRPVLQLGYYQIAGRRFFKPGPWDEDLFWLFGPEALSPKAAPQGDRRHHPKSIGFPDGGIYLLHGRNSKAVVRCTNFRARPSHADQLHVDLWWKGINIACDAGTYLYTGPGVWRNGLAHTRVHNTVTVDDRDQMDRVSRFTWTNWAGAKALLHDQQTWRGRHDGYNRLPDPVGHLRTVMALPEDRWLVLDHLSGRKPHSFALHWLLNDFPFEVQESQVRLDVDGTKLQVQAGLREGESEFSVVRGDESGTRGWRSRYYGQQEPALSLVLQTNRSEAVFWTFFGMESDSLEAGPLALKIHYGDFETSVDLDPPVR